ncbi:hypothetical protein K491DRAFT_759346 [Lophiostoma macrostomum CBS 122681]|uniref:Uncharacterized protein n=1 Tax=Lophiostoma macrostomum CBS 122681 TaxID=1314788 RepID=A0A6A6T3Y6_9PLEO|nr:hypothetical protein K491DRAFT_759346 [Lophiostoma macrostomum CBS 122681]
MRQDKPAARAERVTGGHSVKEATGTRAAGQQRRGSSTAQRCAGDSAHSGVEAVLGRAASVRRKRQTAGHSLPSARARASWWARSGTDWGAVERGKAANGSSSDAVPTVEHGPQPALPAMVVDTSRACADRNVASCCPAARARLCFETSPRLGRPSFFVISRRRLVAQLQAHESTPSASQAAGALCARRTLPPGRRGSEVE